MISLQETGTEVAAPSGEESVGVQAGTYLVELSLDWIVLRASENIHHLLGQSHVTLIDEPLGRFVRSQALHDLRNLFSRLSGTIGVTRAYQVRLTNEPDLVDLAFQLSDGRVLLEAVPCSEGHFGEAFGTVAGLIAGLSGTAGQRLLDGAARRMRALTGYDRVALLCDGKRAESSRGTFSAALPSATSLPVIIADCELEQVPVFPRKLQDTSVSGALMRSADRATSDQLRSERVRAALTVSFNGDGFSGEFRCHNRSPRKPSFEIHAAAELFAQLFSLQYQIDRLKSA
jgi:light-regulated signal transduction histidine kinase (bacteriophytochrome)